MTTESPAKADPAATKTVAVLDYGSGNIRSAERAIARSGVQVQVTSDTDIALAADGLVVPGVGAFAACMDGLLAVGGDKIISERVRLKRPVLGICVGHQVLFARGIEHGRMTQGCGLWPGDVEQIEAHRLPHMGWNSLQTGSDSAMFAGVEEERFYFVHSYAVRSFAAPPGAVTTWAEHGGDRFLAGVEDGVLWSTQFHPEKSGDAGAQLIKNWVGTL